MQMQMVSTTIVKTTNTYTNIVVTKPPAGTGSARCQTKDHAGMLNQMNLAVGRKIPCAKCLLLISWENLYGEESPVQQGG